MKLRVSTDGRRVSAVEVESGPPLLVQAAKENLKTWQFEPHTPTGFEVTFQYKLLLPQCDSECHCDSVEKESVLLQLPANIALSAKIPPICDPAVNVGEKPTAAQDKPTEIRLTVKRNARAVPNPDHIVLSASDYAGRVTVTDGRFDVPSEILHAKSFSFSADVVGNHIEIVNLSPGELHYQDWTLLLADRHYPEDYASSVPKGADIGQSCMLVLDSEHLDPGVVMFQERCRSKRAR